MCELRTLWRWKRHANGGSQRRLCWASLWTVVGILESAKGSSWLFAAVKGFIENYIIKLCVHWYFEKTLSPFYWAFTGFMFSLRVCFENLFFLSDESIKALKYDGHVLESNPYRSSTVFSTSTQGKTQKTTIRRRSWLHISSRQDRNAMAWSTSIDCFAYNGL